MGVPMRNRCCGFSSPQLRKHVHACVRVCVRAPFASVIELICYLFLAFVLARPDGFPRTTTDAHSARRGSEFSLSWPALPTRGNQFISLLFCLCMYVYVRECVSARLRAFVCVHVRACNYFMAHAGCVRVLNAWIKCVCSYAHSNSIIKGSRGGGPYTLRSRAQ